MIMVRVSKEVGRLELGFGLGFAFRVEVWVSGKG